MKTRPLYALAAIGGATLLALAAPRTTSGQNQGIIETPPTLTSLVNDLTAQSRQIAQNQALIDAKVAEVEELVRQARIYTARAGKGAK